MKIPGMGNMMKQVQKMQDDMKKAQAEFDNTEFTGEAGAGMVQVKITGKDRCEFTISPDAKDDDVEILQDLCAAAMINALQKQDKAKEEIMGGVAGGMNIPGMDQLLK